MTAPTAEASPVVPPRRRRRRWLLRIPIAIVSFAITLVILVQVLLWTDYPRRIAEDQITRILRVNAKVHEVSIGWTGVTHIKGVELTLPMEADPFLRIEKIVAHHASLPLIAFDQSLERVDVSGVDVALKQAESGRWNVEHFIAPSSGTGSGQPANLLADLPEAHLDQVQVAVTLNDGRRALFDDVRLDLTKPDRVSAKLSAAVGKEIVVDGVAASTVAMPHDLSIRVTNLPADVRTMLNIDPSVPVNADLKWTGRRTGSGIAGTLRIDQAAYDVFHLAGGVDVHASDTIEIHPRDLALNVSGGATVAAKVQSGRITMQGQSLHVDALRGEANGGTFAAAGQVDLATLVGTLRSHWANVLQADVITHGQVDLSTKRELTGDLTARVAMNGAASMSAGRAEFDATIDARIRSFNDARADFHLLPLIWTPTQGAPIQSPALVGQLTADASEVRIASLRLAEAGNGQLDVYGAFDRHARTWWTTIDTAQLQLPVIAAQGVHGPIDLSVAANGTLTRVDASKLYVKVSDAVAFAWGSYDAANPKPLWLQSWVWYDKPLHHEQGAQVNALRASGEIAGTLQPLELISDLDVVGSEILIASRSLGDVSLHVSAAITPDIATIRSRDTELLGGQWTLSGDWTRAGGQPPTLVATFRDLPAERIGELVGRQDLSGTIDRGQATIRVSSTSIDDLFVAAIATGRDLADGPFQAERLEFTATVSNGQLIAKPVLFQADGKIELEAAARIGEPITANAAITDWPLPALTRLSADGIAEHFKPRVSGVVEMRFDPETTDLTGNADIRGSLARNEDNLADIALNARLDRKVLTLEQAKIYTLDGNIAANGVVDLRSVNETRMDIVFSGLVPSRLAWLNPLVQEVQGSLDGTLSIHPATASRPLGPIQIELALRPTDANYRGVQIGAMDIDAFAEVDLPARLRFVTGKASIGIADGTIEPFVRISKEGAGELSQLVTADFSRLDLRQLVRAVDDDGKDITGRLAGRVQLYGSTKSLKTISGDARIDLTESDLANFGPINALYNVLSVGTEGSDPNGSGHISLRVGEGVLTIDDADYFNRGVYANAVGSVSEIDKLPDSSLDLTVFGSLQPLRAVKLPFFGDINDTFAALQSSVTAIHAGGTLKDPDPKQVAINSLGDSVQRALLGKVSDK